jgi:dihydrofolate synthase/folylpolyglutamate synthase
MDSRAWLQQFVDTEEEGFGDLGERQLGGLEKLRELAEALSLFNVAPRYIHVAGTKGKGSCCRILDTMLRDLGYTTGRYTSPHLLHLGERFSFNGRHLDEFDFLEELESFRYSLNQSHVANNLLQQYLFSQFEILTLFAFWLFQKERLDFAVIETGMGGLNDATNILPTSAACLITAIGNDHLHHLGGTQETLILHKLGIAKRGVPLVISQQPDEVEALVQEQASDVGRQLTCEVAFVSGGTTKTEELTHHANNVAACLALLDAIRESPEKNDPSLTDYYLHHHELKQSPGYQEAILTDPYLVFDVAHDPLSFSALFNCLNNNCSNDDKREEVWFVALNLKNEGQIGEKLENFSHLDGLKKIFFVETASVRSASLEQMREAFEKSGLDRNKIESATLPMFEESMDVMLDEAKATGAQCLLTGSHRLAPLLDRYLKARGLRSQ